MGRQISHRARATATNLACEQGTTNRIRQTSLQSSKEKTATSKLKLAKSCLQGNLDAGERRLREIVQNYSGTKAAAEAEEMLKELTKE